MNSDTHKRITALGLLVTIGIVFGDIGTSPLYVMRAVIGATPNFDADYIIGAVSCVIWTLTLQTTLKYVIIALRADNNGEGGILSLFALLRKMPRRWLYIVAAAGAAALIADGVITPAITVTSAIEGLNVVFGNNVPTLPIVLVIIALLFAAQQLGTGRIGRFSVRLCWPGSLCLPYWEYAAYPWLGKSLALSTHIMQYTCYGPARSGLSSLAPYFFVPPEPKLYTPTWDTAAAATSP